MFTPRSFLVALAAGLALCPIPLLGNLHIESALVAAIIGCFWAGWLGSEGPSRDDARCIARIVGHLYVIGAPLLVSSILRSCFSVHGAGFWLLYPLPSVLFGYSMGRCVRLMNIPWARSCTIGVLAAVAAGEWALEFFTLPQVYFFNHVWGGWPGPIYDETVTISASLLWFRMLTLAWAALFWYVPAVQNNASARWKSSAALIVMAAIYLNVSTLGIISPRGYIQQQLGGHHQTSHFSIYYDEEHYTTTEIAYISERQEFYYEQLTAALNLHRPESAPRIESYLYASPWQKKELVGAKFTSYVPVWLTQDQLHIAKQQINGSLKHELVHVLAKQFGNRLLNASWSIGLVEGLAVALAPDASEKSTINQIVAAQDSLPSANEMARALSPWGFYGGRSAVNYTQTGSFVQFLLEQYPVAKMKQAYKTGSIKGSYVPSMNELVAQWHDELRRVPIDSTDAQNAARLFGFPSLFEQKCPHVLSPFAATWDGAQQALALNDTARALPLLDDALRLSHNNPRVKSQWAFVHLRAGRYNKVRQQVSPQDSLAEVLLLTADAHALSDSLLVAKKIVNKAQKRITPQTDATIIDAVQMRQHAEQWHWYRESIYEGAQVDSAMFSRLWPRTQLRIIEQAWEQQSVSYFKQLLGYASIMEFSYIYISSYLRLIDWLIFEDRFSDAEQWLARLESYDLRLRYEEQLVQLRAWLQYKKGDLAKGPL